MGALKGLVIGLGVLIVAGLALLVYGVVRKSADPGFRLFAASPAPAAPGRPWGDVVLPMKKGCHIAGMQADGGRLHVRIGPEGECGRIVVVDPATGQVLGSFTAPP